MVKSAVNAWREGSPRSQAVLLGALVVAVAVSLGISWSWETFPLTGFLLWLFIGVLLLRFRQLLILAAAVAIAGVGSLFGSTPMTPTRWVAVVMYFMILGLATYTASRQITGLPSTLSSALLTELRGRLNRQGRVGKLPEGWSCETAMVSAHSVGYAGDFMVAEVDGDRLALVLVDVVGKGVRAAPSALMLAGAFGGMVSALRGEDLLRAANSFLLRQDSEDAFATAVCIEVDLSDGSYTILSAGHPPALRYVVDDQRWLVDASRGLALGVLPDPHLEASTGVLQPGEALMFYTDGVVESRTNDIEDGIAWLCNTATRAMRKGFAGAPQRIIDQVPVGDDDRALLLLSRASAPAHRPHEQAHVGQAERP